MTSREPAGPDGPRAVPFRQFILKMNGRCNLACRYCYLYAGPDSGWRHRPATPAAPVLDATAARIAEHAAAHGLTDIAVVLHGGEPLLAETEALGAVVDRVRAAVPVDCAVHGTVQTNGTLLDDDRLRTLAAHRIRVGVSLDGGLPGHNLARVDHAGRPSWPAAARGLRLLAEDRHRGSYAGVLCVVDLASDPAEVYGSLLDFSPPAVDFLLPHGNWSVPPPGLPAPAERPSPYGDWLCTVFDQWWRSDRRRIRVRIFEECLALLLGVPAATESLGLRAFDAVVVETDGSIEQVDSLKSAYEGAAATGLDVFHHTFDEALAHPGVAARQGGLAALAGQCRRCPLVQVCGGGNYAHRYVDGEGFRHPSVYCADLQRLIRHVADRLAEAAAA
ncbi:MULTISPECIES: FxsB family cyclophane-forming radical SAM/SPASM peptide maturase [Streptomyces]|uniref:FxsB family cyclophane-forming radical SAM/SPASM peptide maturase n=2 Tax=Streptomyces TaxID=1883 RepID=UPI0022B02D5C|nr:MULTISPECIES: FxsB family cyclophane-forming radical SAM/SPASM peptide maturase [Streptomyces]MCZ4095919.1 FxsB family radical SAM/SPASM domain protein [Streptomyces sp. H39-C1]